MKNGQITASVRIPDPGTHSFIQEEAVSGQVVGAQQASQDADGSFKQININIFVEDELWGNPFPGFFKLWKFMKVVWKVSMENIPPYM